MSAIGGMIGTPGVIYSEAMFVGSGVSTVRLPGTLRRVERVAMDSWTRTRKTSEFF